MRWRGVSLSERSAAHSHFLNLCEMLGEAHPVEEDATGERFTIEKRVGKAHGGKGFADVWKRDHFAWEYKRKDGDLKKVSAEWLMKGTNMGPMMGLPPTGRPNRRLRAILRLGQRKVLRPNRGAAPATPPRSRQPGSRVAGRRQGLRRGLVLTSILDHGVMEKR